MYVDLPVFLLCFSVCLSLCRSRCLLVCPPICLHVGLPVSLTGHLSDSPSDWLRVCPSKTSYPTCRTPILHTKFCIEGLGPTVCQSLRSSILRSACLPAYLSIRPPVLQSAILPVCLSASCIKPLLRFETNHYNAPVECCPVSPHFSILPIFASIVIWKNKEVRYHKHSAAMPFISQFITTYRCRKSGNFERNSRN